MAGTKALGIFYEMGTGKTAIALMYIYERLQRQSNLKALVVCPPKLISNWKDDIENLILFEGVTPSGLAALKKAITFVSYQKTYYTTQVLVKKAGRQYYKKVRPLRPEVDRPWDILCVDESHKIGIHSSIQSKSVWEIAKKSKERYIFTGTPIHGGGGKPDYAKLFGQFRVLCPFTWMTWTQFKARYVTKINPRFHKIEAYNEPACRRLMEKYAIICRLEDCVDLPGFTEITVDCPLTETSVYHKLKNMDVESLGIDLTTGGSAWTKMMQVCSGSMKRSPTDTLMLRTSKDDRLEEILEDMEDKLVIFCNFRASIDRVKKICDEYNRKTVVVDGRTKDENNWKQFQYGDKDTIICQYGSGGAGLNLYGAKYMIFYEPNPSALMLSQAKGRIYRTGQKEKCIYYYFSTPKTVEAHAWESVRNGKDYSDKELERMAALD